MCHLSILCVSVAKRSRLSFQTIFEMKFFIATVFFLSGAAGLIYEITWVRLFSVLFGNSTYAISVVVSVFMGGLALGSYLFGKWIDERRNPFRIYGLIEIGIAISAFLVPFFLRLAEPLIFSLYQTDMVPLARITFVRTLIAVVIMILPTALMGATLPIVSKYFVRGLKEVGGKVGFLYGLNTLGAVIGCFLTGFFFIRYLGVTNSIYLACGMNGMIGLAVLFYDYAFHPLPAVLSESSEKPLKEVTAQPRFFPFFVLIAFFISGFTALSYEVIWARILGFILQRGMSIYAFTVMLTLFLAGLGLGSLIYSRWFSKRGNPIRLFGILEILIGISVFACLFFMAKWNTAAWLKFKNLFFINHFLKASLLMFVPTLIMGIAFPLVCRLITENFAKLGSSVGKAYAVNTLGSVLGPLATGFVLIPYLGSEISLKMMVTSNLLVGLILVTLFSQRTHGYLFKAVLAVPVCLFVIFLHSYKTQLVLDFFNVSKEKVVYFKEGSSASVMATEAENGISLNVGGTVGAGTLRSFRETTELLAYIPLLLHKDPRDVAVVGFGTGRTPGFYAQHPSVKHVDMVEISESVFEVGREFFSSYNQDVLNSPKAKAFIDDGFNFMKYTQNRYDVISLDPFTPHNPGSARLYSKDFLEYCKSKLKKDGLVILWTLPSWSRSKSFGVALNTFHSVFPHTTVWLTPNKKFFIFLATPRPLQIDVSTVVDRLAARPELRGRYPYVIKDLPQFLGSFFLDEKGVQNVVSSEKLPFFTLERPNLEFLIHTDTSERLGKKWLRKMQSPLSSLKKRLD